MLICYGYIEVRHGKKAKHTKERRKELEEGEKKDGIFLVRWYLSHSLEYFLMCASRMLQDMK